MKEKIIHALKGLAAFVVIYGLTAVLTEIVLIVILTINGYDALHGEMPDTLWIQLLPNYSFAFFAIIAILFTFLIRKKKWAALMLHFDGKAFAGMLGSMAAGAVLVAIAIAFLTITGQYQFRGMNEIQWGILAATFGGWLIQGFSEELLCRGLVQNYLAEKLPNVAAILLSAVTFILPHVASILDFSPVVMLFSFVNLLLVSVLFSLSMLKFKSLWVPAGIHIGWNFMLSYVCGLEVSGGQNADSILGFLVVSSNDWLHGGGYGIEAGLVVTVLLIVCDLILLRAAKD